jgi:hypothetical protein
MDEGETDKQLREQIEQLRCENELLKAKIIELEARLARYENAHAPPSLRHGRNRKKDQDKNTKGIKAIELGKPSIIQKLTGAMAVVLSRELRAAKKITKATKDTKRFKPLIIKSDPEIR